MNNVENKVEVIAEAGVNHNGDFNIAKKMIDVASEAGADTVKFQVSIPSLGLSRFAEKADYAKNTTGEDESFLEMCEKLHLPLNSYTKLKDYCIKKNINFPIAVDRLVNQILHLFRNRYICLYESC